MRLISFVPLVAAFTISWSGAHAQEIDSDHLFAFTQGTDIGEAGTTEFESTSNGRFGKRGGRYGAYAQESEIGYIPVKGLHVFAGGSLAYFDIAGVPGLENRRRALFQELEIEVRYRVMDRATAPFGLAFQIQPGWSAADEISGEHSSSYGVGFALLADKEIVKDRVIAAFNLAYEPEAARESGSWERESALDVSGAVLARARRNLFIGFGAQHLRRYGGLGLNRLAGQATFAGPNLCWYPKGFWVIAGWSAQVAGDASGSSNSMDLVNFERHRARLTIGFAL